ncbi:chitin deacetylase [Emydomyces testavorans]|uniref:Chitin deacetylase n=1 Tax=Emydomyces testavorans TaxID=2070801 RepID=A0AAF0IHQ0_9EURO|nr:chitin deacetylase [Emydomyces testavorans]
MFLRHLLPSILVAGAGPAIVANGKPTVTGTKVPSFQASGKLPSLRLPDPLPAPGFATRKSPEHKKRGYSRCGPKFGACQEGLCCSAHGYCGYGPEYCQAPDCLFDYGSGCDAMQWPDGEDTSEVPRPHVGEVPYGFIPIYQCVNPNTIALTYDDGPNIYTSDLLDILDSYDAKATFFVTAVNSNKGSIDDPNYPWVDILHRMYHSGHQIASHTWSHQNLDQITSPLRREQMIKAEMALRNVLGAFPTYMRPPYSACSVQSGCLADMDDLGYHVAYFNVDTDDYNNASPHQIQRSKDLFDHSMGMHEATGRPMLVIAHDVHEQTVYNLTVHMLRRLYQSDYQPVTLGECLGDPPSNWYRWIDPAAAPPHNLDPNTNYRRPGEKPVSNDGTCGREYTCVGSKFGKCCSEHGFCGNASEHCGWGCQESAGECFFGTGKGRLLKEKAGKLGDGRRSNGDNDHEDGDHDDDGLENDKPDKKDNSNDDYKTYHEDDDDETDEEDHDEGQEDDEDHEDDDDDDE